MRKRECVHESIPLIVICSMTLCFDGIQGRCPFIFMEYLPKNTCLSMHEKTFYILFPLCLLLIFTPFTQLLPTRVCFTYAGINNNNI